MECCIQFSIDQSMVHVPSPLPSLPSSMHALMGAAVRSSNVNAGVVLSENCHLSEIFFRRGVCVYILEICGIGFLSRSSENFHCF